MIIKEILLQDYEKFVNKHPLKSFHQTSNYALLMGENNYNYEYIGLVDENDKIYGVSLVLIKKLNMFINYAYCPKGFLIDYNNKELLKELANALKEYYKSKKIAFVKINPEIAIGSIDSKNKNEINYNQNRVIKQYFTELRFQRIKRSINFETKQPIFNAILPLKNFNVSSVNKVTRNKINSSLKKGLEIVKGNRDDVTIFFEFIKRKKKRNLAYYKNIYNVFNKNNMIDIFLVKINYRTYLENYKGLYEQEQLNNEKLLEKLNKSKNKIILNKKMESDKLLIKYKDHMLIATKNLNNKNETYIAGALCIKYDNRVNIYISGFDKNFDNYSPNYFLHYSIFNHYKKDYDFIDLNGISGDFRKDNKYYGLNEFKLSWHPKVFEFIGEYDIVINEKDYKTVLNSKSLFSKMDY